MDKIGYLFFIIFGLCYDSFSQKLLFHKNRNHEALYSSGEVISFRLKGSKAKITERIKGFEDSLIVFQNFKINPHEVSHLYVDDKTRVWYPFRFKYEKIFLIAGIGYLVLDVLNTGELNENTLIVSGSLITAGLLAKWIISDRIKIKGRRKLVIIDL